MKIHQYRPPANDSTPVATNLLAKADDGLSSADEGIVHMDEHRWIDDDTEDSGMLSGPSWADHRSLEATYHDIIDRSNEVRKQAMLEREKVRLYPTSVRFINGLASSYEDDWPFELEGQIKIEEYTAAINQINNTLDDYWPCDFCFYCGYFCCPCTLGTKG